MKSLPYFKIIPELFNSSARRCFVLGNVSVDMDSVVSSLVLSYAMQTLRTDSDPIYLPLINCSEAELDFRFDIVHLLKKHGINSSSLLYSDKFEEITKEDQIILVDHNMIDDLRFTDHVIAIYDHHKWMDGPRPNLKTVMLKQPIASALTLIINNVLVPNDLLDHFDADFLAPTLLSDSHGFSKDLHNFKWIDEDLKLVKKLSKLGNFDYKDLEKEYKNEKKNVERNIAIGVEGLVKKDRKYYSYIKHKVTYSTIPLDYDVFVKNFKLLELPSVLSEYDYYVFQFSHNKGKDKKLVFYNKSGTFDDLINGLQKGLGQTEVSRELGDEFFTLVIEGHHGRKTVEPLLRIILNEN